MAPKDIQEITDAIHNSDRTHLILAGIVIALIFIGTYFIQYLQTKAISVATKEDIGELTKITEGVKSQVAAFGDAEKIKYTLKYKALLKSLEIIDAFTSTHWLSSQDVPIIPQYADIVDLRECHNQIVLTCDNSEIVSEFYRLMIPDTDALGDHMTNLIKYRNLVRAELGFGDPLPVDPNTVWFATSASQRPNPAP